MPASVGNEMIKKQGLDVNLVLKKLLKAIGAEFTTYYYYTLLRNHCVGADYEGLKEITEDARLEDRLHFEALVPRVYELGGDLWRDIRDMADDAGCPDAYLPKGLTVKKKHTPKDMENIVKILLDAERCAVRTYTELVILTQGKDFRTCEMAMAVLHEEIEHESWFEEYLEGKPSGHFRRGKPGEGPYTQVFRHIE